MAAAQWLCLRRAVSVLAIAAACALPACASSNRDDGNGNGNVLLVSRYVWDQYQAYLRTIGANHPGAFAVSLDGLSWGATTCRTIRCGGTRTYSEDALANCRIENPDCVVFAKRDEIVVDYEIIE